MNNTKIICTIGPASSTTEIMNEMMDAGMSIARINMSHGTYESLQALIDNLTPLRKERGLKLMIDTKGPEMRIGTFENGSIVLNEGQEFVFTTRDVIGNNKEVSLKYKPLVEQVKVGDKIYANNALIVLNIVKKTKTDLICKVEFGGKLSNNKSLNVPGIVPTTPYISEVDKQDILFGIKNKADFFALSFVSEAQNIIDIKNFLNKNGAGDVKLIAKIENEKGVKNAESILAQCDGLMVARGDLGVEIPLEKLPIIQKKLISQCNVQRKIAIVATEMLESMTNSTRPTRAEVNDVANAVYDETNATMLSGETSVGQNPVLVVKTMSKIISEVEKMVYSTNDC